MKRNWYYIALILGTAFILRIMGITFGLPLWVVGDEPGLIFGTLKMLELKTLLPSLHVAEFSRTFYYGPYLPFLYLVPFTLVSGVKFLFFSGNFLEFKNFLAVDPSSFFLTARYISALFGTAAVWFIYQVGRTIFKNERAGLFSAAFLAFSFLLVNFSHWARHWAPVTFFFTLVLYILSRPQWSVARRYTWALLVSGLSVGVSLQAGLSLFLVLLWFLLVDKLSIIDSLKEKWLIVSSLGLTALITSAYLIWPNSFGFLSVHFAPGASTVSKDFSGLAFSYVLHVSNLFIAEPAFFIFFVIGLFYCARQYRSYFWSFFVFILLYIAIFYLSVGTNSRYIQMVYPLLALLAGLGLATLYDTFFIRSKTIASIFLLAVLLAMLLPTARLVYLLVKNDTRIQAIHWVEQLPDRAKVVVAVPLMRLSATKEAVDNLERLDPGALRTVDKAERISSSGLSTSRRFDVLNFYTVSSPDVFHNLHNYLKENKYEYLVIDEEYARERGIRFQPGEKGEIIKTFKGSVSGIGYGLGMVNQGIPDGYGDGLRELFLSSSLGPEIKIIKLY